MASKQKTIAKSISLSGMGLHTGVEVNAAFHAAGDDTGIVFKRTDLPEKPSVQAVADFVIDTSRNTVLGGNGFRVGMVEHALSALAGLEIDNALIEIDGPEMPILDGSARNYADALVTAGTKELRSEKRYFEVREPIAFKDDSRGIEILALPADDLGISVMIDYNSSVLGNQFASLEKLSDYHKQIASSRTFVFFRELEVLWRSNLIKGGSLDNAMVILEREVTQSELNRVADLIGKPRVSGLAQGILSTTKLEFSNEPARHKLLDLLGDLALIGHPLKARIFATRPGHQANVEFAKAVRQAVKKEKGRLSVPVFDPNAVPVLDIIGIMSMLPHRPPFLLIDRIMELTGQKIIGVKNVSMNEPFFAGHFPEEPLMPGVLIVEAMAQCGGVFVLNTVENPKEYSTYFLKIDNVRFKRKVVPGDTLVFRLDLLEPIRRGIARMRAQAFVGDHVAAEGEMMAQIIRKKEIT